MASAGPHAPFEPPSYLDSLSCQVLKSKRSVAVVLPPPIPDNDSDVFDDSWLPLADDFEISNNQDALHRLRAATEDNAEDFIWCELPKHFKLQWVQRDLRAALDECPRFARHAHGQCSPRSCVARIAV
jgi:hypothetical protein